MPGLGRCRSGGGKLRPGVDRVQVPLRVRPQVPSDRACERQDLRLAGQGGDEAVQAAQQRARQDMDPLRCR